jgi:hypothetical protein
MAKLELPSDPIIASKLVDHEASKTAKQIEGGVVGKIFGLSTEKPGNIAAIVLILSFVFFACILVWGVDTPTLSKRDQIAIVSSFITLSLGFVFGRTSS